MWGEKQQCTFVCGGYRDRGWCFTGRSRNWWAPDGDKVVVTVPCHNVVPRIWPLTKMLWARHSILQFEKQQISTNKNTFLGFLSGLYNTGNANSTHTFTLAQADDTSDGRNRKEFLLQNTFSWKCEHM